MAPSDERNDVINNKITTYSQLINYFVTIECPILLYCEKIFLYNL